MLPITLVHWNKFYDTLCFPRWLQQPKHRQQPKLAAKPLLYDITNTLQHRQMFFWLQWVWKTPESDCDTYTSAAPRRINCHFPAAHRLFWRNFFLATSLLHFIRTHRGRKSKIFRLNFNVITVIDTYLHVHDFNGHWTSPVVKNCRSRLGHCFQARQDLPLGFRCCNCNLQFRIYWHFQLGGQITFSQRHST